jgi:hypothetical protein
MKPILVFHAAVGCLMLILAGCGGDYVGGTVPVKGKVTINGQPAKYGAVTFWPDSAKGNNAKYEASAVIGDDGTYTLKTRDKLGATAGAYKVTVSIIPKGGSDNTKVEIPKEEAPAEYTKKETTKLAIEVSASAAPGAYDLNVK